MARTYMVLLLTALVVGAALAEPAFRRQQAQQAQPQAQDGDAEDAPYAPSGWKPSGQRLELPAKATKPGSQYGAPANPAEELDATAEPASDSDKPAASTSDQKRSEKQKAAPEDAYQGEYYVILPDGRLQRVQFAARLEASQAGQAARTEQADEDEQADGEQQDEPAEPAVHTGTGQGPRPGARPVPRPAARPLSAVPAAPLLQGRYFVVLADGSLQEVQLAGRLEATEAQDEAQDEGAEQAVARPRAGQPRPQLRPQPQAVGQPGVPSSFVAELRFMEVPPITGPVFSYSGPLVRVQRRV